MINYHRSVVCVCVCVCVCVYIMFANFPQVDVIIALVVKPHFSLQYIYGCSPALIVISYTFQATTMSY